MISTPILVLGYNRPDQMSRLIMSLAVVKPNSIYFSFDGPKNNEDAGLVAKCIETIAMIDWDCEIKLRRSKTNLGLKRAVISGISWFFSQEDFGVILEDDIEPRREFYYYIQECRAIFEYNSSVAVISGNNFVRPTLNFWNGKLGISPYFLGWGWATWAKYWNTFTATWDDVRNVVTNQTLISKVLHNDEALVNRHLEIFRDWQGSDTWAFLWQAHLWNKGWRCAIPPVNLAGNTGIGTLATNCKADMPYVQSWKRYWNETLPPDYSMEVRESPLGDRAHGYILGFGIPPDTITTTVNSEGVLDLAMIKSKD